MKNPRRSVEPVLPNLETSTVTEGDNPCPQRRSKEKAQERISSWMKDLGGPEDV